MVNLKDYCNMWVKKGFVYREGKMDANGLGNEASYTPLNLCQIESIKLLSDRYEVALSGKWQVKTWLTDYNEEEGNYVFPIMVRNGDRLYNNLMVLTFFNHEYDIMLGLLNEITG